MSFGAGFSPTKNMESGSLVPYCLIFHIFETVCPSFSGFSFKFFGVD
jgi:hypothetical protein